MSYEAERDVLLVVFLSLVAALLIYTAADAWRNRPIDDQGRDLRRRLFRADGWSCVRAIAS